MVACWQEAITNAVRGWWLVVVSEYSDVSAGAAGAAGARRWRCSGAVVAV